LRTNHLKVRPVWIASLSAWIGLIALVALGDASRLVSQMKNLGVQFGLLVESQAIDEEPVWSPDGQFLAINVDGKWFQLDAASVVLRMGTWHDRKAIAVAHPVPELQDISETDVLTWQKAARFDPRTLTTESGVTIELAPENLGTLFRVTRKGATPEILWKTALENCHSLALSPDESLVAFLCELNGLVIFEVGR
jgi:Tol biopolymer transport system component